MSELVNTAPHAVDLGGRFVAPYAVVEIDETPHVSALIDAGLLDRVPATTPAPKGKKGASHE